MESKRKLGPYVWQRFKNRFKVRMLIFGGLVAVL
jgi:hypothetical protein